MKDILYGVKYAEFEEIDKVTQEPVPDGIKVVVDTSESVEFEPTFSEGEEQIARSDEKVLAIVRTDDLLIGYDVTFKDNTFDPEIAGLVEGAVLYKDSANGAIKGYRSPKLSEGNSKMKPFRINLYVANYQGDSIVNYVKVTLNNCSGKAPKFSASKEFYAPEYTIKAREATRANLPIKSVTYVDELPTATAPVIISSKIGDFTFGAKTITNIPQETTVGALLNGLYVSYNGSKKVVDAEGNEKETGKVLATDKVVIYDLRDEETLKTEYTLQVQGA